MKIVVLGRDGVINQPGQDKPIDCAAEWQAIPGSLEAIARLSRAGYRVVVTTNQQGVGRGALSIDALHDIHDHMLRLVQEAGGSIDSIYFAPTGNPDAHGRRQPKHALLKEIEQRYAVAMRDIVVVGDAREDLEAAAAAGAKPVLVRTGRGEDTLRALTDFEGVTIFANLARVADELLAKE